jgi:hypothetical protein
MKIWVKVHQNAQGQVLAACDEDLLGKTFEKENLCLHVHENFYKGELVDEEEFKSNLKDKNNLNIVGENAVNIAKNHGLVNEILYIEDVPYTVAVIL